MSFTDKLAKLSRRSRHFATGREFEEEGYEVRWDGAEHDRPDPAGRVSVELTLDRYKNGPGHGTNDPDAAAGGDPNYNYYVYPGSAAWEHKFGGFDWIDDAFMKYGKSQPSSLRGLCDSLKTMPNRLCADQVWQGTKKPLERYDRDDLDIAGTEILLENGIAELEYWSGETAAVYRTTFGANGDKWAAIIQNNYYLAELLVASAEAQLAVFITARESITNIAEKTVDTLWSVHEGDGVGLKTVLTIVGAVVGTALSLASAGTAATLVGAGISITNALISEAENGGDITTNATDEDVEISGDTVAAVLNSAYSAIDSLDTKINEKQNDIRDVLRDAYNHALQQREKYEIRIDKDTPPMSREGLGTRDLSADTHYLTIAATEAFPDAAAPMLKAHATLAGSGGDGGEFTAEIYGGVTSVHPAWVRLRDLLQDLTGANGAKVKRAGEVLLDYAVDVTDVDEASAKKIEKSYRELDVEYSGTDHEVYVPVPDTQKNI